MKSFDFSVIMAVYNVEPYLREALESLRKQTLGFERIQVILVDDGSRDGSGEICDRWAERHPDNVAVIHQENQGVSAARNNGLSLAKGKYVNFMDADDLMMEDTFRRVYDFFSRHEGETDAVSVPVYDFGASQGENWQNLKYRQGSRIIDLTEEYQIRQALVNAAFIEREAARAVRFDEKMPFAEDFKYMIEVLRRKEKLGVVSECGYRYRIRGTGTSASEKAHREKSWYTTIFDTFYFPILDQNLPERARPPRWLQFGILWDMRCRVHEDYAAEMNRLLSKTEQEDYLNRVRAVLSRIDDQVIRDAPEHILEPVYKAWLVRRKHPDWPARLVQEGDDVQAFLGDIPIVRGSQSLMEITEVRDHQGKVLISGLLRLLPILSPNSIRLLVNGTATEAEPIPCPVRCSSRFGETIEAAWSFQAEPALPAGRVTDLSFEIALAEGMRCRVQGIVPGPYLPVSGKCADLAVTGEWKYMMTADFLRFVPYGTQKSKIYRSFSIFRAAMKDNAYGALRLRIAASLAKKLCRKPIWLISDRINKADDNGEALFLYLMEHHRGELRPCFVVSKDSPDYERLRARGRVLPAGGFRHKVASLICKTEISSSDRGVFHQFGDQEEWLNDLMIRPAFVFLQHGITRGNVSNWLNKWTQNFSGLVIAAHPERQNFLRYGYGYTEREIWMTGFPRFDRLEDRRDKIVTIMPTWRKWLFMEDPDPETGKKELRNGFENTEYFRFYHALLNHPGLLSASKDLGWRIQFFPHPQMMFYIDRFKADNQVELLSPETSYREIYAKSALVVTDYSSAAYDFAYLRKPVIYAQFDKKEMALGGHIYAGENSLRKEESEELGIVTETLEETVTGIIRYMKTGCVMEPEYRERADRFFAFSDRNNCQRVYERIKAMLAERAD